MANIVLLGFPNESAQGYTTLATSGLAGLTPAGFEVTNLATEEPTDRTRFLVLDPRHTQVSFDTADLGVSFDGLALISHNLPAGNQFRVLVRLTSAALHQPVCQAPNASSSATNVTGGVTNVDDDPVAPDGLVITPTNKSAIWAISFSFASLSPGGTLNTGADMMAFVMRLRRGFVGAGADKPLTYPTVYCELVESGSLVRPLGHRAVVETAAGGQFLIFPFSASELADPSGSNVEVHVSCVPGASLSGSSYAELETLCLYYEPVPGVEDSGWITVPGDTRLAPEQPTRSAHWFPPARIPNARSYTLLVRTDQSRHDAPFTANTNAVPVGAIRPPDSFVDLGVVSAGAAITLQAGIRRGSGPLAGPIVEEVPGLTAGGQSYAMDSFRRRQSQSIDLIVTGDEARLLQDQIGWRRGHSGAFYVVLDPNLTLERQLFTSFWATLKELGHPMPLGRYRSDGQMLHTMSIQFDEKL